MHQELRNGGLPEKGHEAVRQVAPTLVSGTWVLVAASPRTAQQTSLPAIESIEAAHDVLQGQFFGGSGKSKAPAGTSGRCEHPGSAKLVQDLGQVVSGNGESLCDVIDANGRVVRLVCEVEDRSEGILTGS